MIALALVVLGSVLPANAGNEVTMSVTPQLSLEPGWANVTIRVERNPENRSLRVEADGPEYFRSSVQQLDGEASPSVRHLRLDGMPHGRYILRAIVTRADGSTKEAALTMEVVSGRGR
jgi:hypothetical protein